MSDQLQVLRDGLAACFNMQELAELCALLDVELANCGGDTHNNRATQIVLYFSRRHELDNLLNYCRKARPRYNWPARVNGNGTARQRQGHVKVLFLAAEPTDQARLRTSQEARAIEQQLRLYQASGKFAFVLRLAVRAPDLSQALLEEKPQIVHFAGHGTAQGISLEDERGRSQLVTEDALAVLFGEVTGVKCVILNACYSKTQAESIAKHVPYVVGIDAGITDAMAIAFSTGFYQALGNGRHIPAAYRLGMAQIKLQGGTGVLPILIG
jgi:hypothetical protein